MATNAVDVYVKLSTGRAVQYDLHPRSSIEDVIEMVAKDEGVADNQVRLKYQGKILVPTKSIGDYGVRAETILKSEVLVPKTLALVLNLPEGKIEELTISNLESAETLMQEISDKCGISHDLLDIECKGQKLTSSTSKLLELGIENCSEITVKPRKEEIEPDQETTVPNKETMDEKEKESVLTSFQAQGRHVEVVFSFDTTGSMFKYLAEVRAKLKECCTRLIKDIPNIRIGLIAHGDYCDQDNFYVLRSADLTNDVDRLVSFAWDAPETEGGDPPECYEWVLRKAQFLDWAEDSAKALVVIGDIYPHPPSYTDQNIRWRDELDVLKGMGVKVYGVQCGDSETATHFYAEMANVTEGRHLIMSHFDVITDMFLAVCYRETSEELLEEFQQELEGAGRMSEDAAAMFKELTETEEDKKEKKKKKKKEEGASSRESTVSSKDLGEWWNYTKVEKASKWWNYRKVEKASVCPCYLYDIQTDTWKYASDTTTPTSTLSSRNSSKTKRRRRCSVM